MIIDDICLNISRSMSQCIVSTKQGETDRRMVISFRDGARPYSLPDGAIAVFSATTPAGATLYNNCTVDGDRVVYDFTENTTASVGAYDAEIIVYNGDKVVVSATITVQVEKRAASAKVITSSDEYKALDKMVVEGTELYANTDALYKDLVNKTGNFAVDKTYTPSSSFAQSGTAVSEAVSGAANSIMTHKAGERVDLYDLSPLKHTISVKARSTNKLAPSILGTWQCTANIAGDTLITLTSTGTNGVAYAKVGRVLLEKGKTYICRLFNATNTANVLAWLPNTTTTVWNATTQTYTPTEDTTVDIVVYMKSIGDGATSSFYIQLEEGTTPPTKYTPYKNVSTAKVVVNDTTYYNINADGIVEGVTSIYPTTTLTTDAEGVVLDVEYNIDTKNFIYESQSSVKDSLEKANLPISSDILERVYDFKYYTSISNAINGVESDRAFAKVGVYTDTNGSRHLVVLDDLTESAPITLSSDIDINLNGKTVSLASNAQFNIEANVAIDGKMPHSKIEKIVATSSVAERIFRVNSGTLTTYSGLFKVGVSQASRPCMAFHNVGGAVEINDSEMYAEAEGTAPNIACVVSSTHATLNGCKATVCSSSISNIAVNNDGEMNINNSTIYADGINNGTSIIGCGVMVAAGVVTIRDSVVYGTSNGIVNYATLFIKGGVYSGVGHGGLYLTEGVSYIEDATIKAVGYSGKYKSSYNYSVQYRTAGFYFGGSNSGGLNAYFDNCDIINETEAPLFSMTNHPTTNSNIYMSCCTVKGDGKIRIDDNNFRLYIGARNNFTIEDVADREDVDKATVVISTSDVYASDLLTG